MILLLTVHVAMQIITRGAQGRLTRLVLPGRFGKLFTAALIFAVVVLATGSAFFKPSLQGSLAQNVTAKNSSLGWGIFYWVVNVGAAIGPILANWLRFGFGWKSSLF